MINEIDVYHALNLIKSPEEPIKHLIEEARQAYTNGRLTEYNRIKKSLPCVTFNFTFDKWKKDRNIIESSGFIYLDIDGTTEIDLNHPLIFASWISLSGSGRGVLVKVDNLSKANFKSTYKAISKELKIESDTRARKATQFTVLSHDSKIHINNDSITWLARKESKIKTAPSTLTYIKKEEEDITEMGAKYEVNYDNIGDIDFGGKDYIFFPDEKELIAKAWIPKLIAVGSRNEILSSIAFQFRALNPDLTFENFENFIYRINKSRCEVPLEDAEVFKIVCKIEKTDILIPMLNTPRRIVFNPESNLTRKEKIEITNKYLGKLRSQKTLKELEGFVNKWDYEENGKVSQRKLAKVSGKNIKTIERHYKEIQRITKKKEKELSLNIPP
ncbi:BT4734/BF3469 family protein [uncultured Psychroserpens sp.]|uniref:BT4734/BF3469 family protein n=1 Tax=uncultured Psychroserpens sp. TaxID=255436 RepID=UPI002624B50D|nr:BT4734/BF3469 family protein [uncultured Psychroserpens sp.]